MSTAITALRYRPEWEPPDEEDLENVPVHKNFQEKVNLFHTGLKTINIKAFWENEDGAKLSQDVCGIEIAKGGKNKVPGINATLLGKVIVARAQTHADELGTDVSYRIKFYGENDEIDDKKAFLRQASFPLSGESDDDEDEEDEEEEEEVFGEPPPAPIRRGNEVQEVKSALGPAQVRPSIIESETVQMMRIQHQWSAGIFAELRASMEQQRKDTTAIMQQQSSVYQETMGSIQQIIEEMRGDLRHSRDEVNKANGRLIKMSEQTASHLSGQQEANRQGWDAFRAGMQMQLQAMNNNMSWERQIMFMQFEQLSKEKAKNDEGAPQWVKDFGPLVVAAIGQVLAAKGGGEQAELLQNLAAKAMAGEEIEEEDVIPTTATPKSKSPEDVMGVPEGVDVREHYEKNKVTSMLQLFNSTLSEEQREKLKKLLPNLAWSALQTALRSKQEALTKSYLLQFVAHVATVPGLDKTLKSEMTDEQNELFQDIVKMVASSVPGGKTILGTDAPDKVPQTSSTPPKDPPPPPPAPPKPPLPPKPPEAAGGESTKKKKPKKKPSKKKGSKAKSASG